MGDFMTENSLCLRSRHAIQESATHGHQRGVAARSGGESIHLLGIENADLRHADALVIREPSHGRHQPPLDVTLRCGNHPHAHQALGAPLGQTQGNESATHAEDTGEQQQPAQPAAHQPHAERLLYDNDSNAEQRQHRQVSQDKKKNALHEPFL